MSVLLIDNIKLGLTNYSRDEAIDLAADLLIHANYVSSEYKEAMHQREKIVSTFIGNGIAIPHGVGDAQKYIYKSGIVVLQFPEGISYNDNTCYLVIGIAGKNDEHIQILSNIAEVVSEEAMAKELSQTKDIQKIYQLFTGK